MHTRPQYPRSYFTIVVMVGYAPLWLSRLDLDRFTLMLRLEAHFPTVKSLSFLLSAGPSVPNSQILGVRSSLLPSSDNFSMLC
jgi:hypothetical protein